MNNVTLPKNQYMRIVNTQEKLRGDLARLQKIVSYITQDEVNDLYITRLKKIEKGLSTDKCIKFKTTNEIRKFFRTL